MSYQVIARKYRPLRFEEVVGQEHVTTTLANAIRAGRIAHAYLFCGPRGTGKTTIARIFAKCLNCTGGPKVDFDDHDPKCREIAEGRSLDVLEIDAASNRGIDEIRELRETCKYAPVSSRFKIYIIDEVHMLTKEAFNALLKTLEEPPEHVKFIFATTDPEKVLPTILSRCQRFDLRRIPAALIVRHLRQIAHRENVRIEDAALFAIARGADGGMRDAECTLDQLISFCGPEIVEADVLSMFGLVARDQVLALTDAILEGDAARALQALDESARGGKDLGRLLGDLLHHFRNLLVFQVSGGDAGLLEAGEAELNAIGRQADRTDPEAVTRIMDVLTEAEARLQDALSRKIALEVALLKAIQMRRAVSLDAVLSCLQALCNEAGLVESSGKPAAAPSGARALANDGDSAPMTAGAPAAVPDTVENTVTALQEAAPVPKPAGPPAGAALAGVPAEWAALWSALLAGVQRTRRFLHNYLLKAFPVSVEREQLTLGFLPAHAGFIPLVDTATNRQIILQELRALGWREPHLKVVQAEPPAALAVSDPAPAAPLLPPPPPAPAPVPGPEAEPAAPAQARSGYVNLDPAYFKDDPLIREALEIFKGRIARVVAPAPPAS